MLAMADRKGRIHASIPGLANRGRVTLEECEHALDRFQAPDKYSRTPDNDGRRIERIDGGWQLLNYSKYREMRDEEARKEYMRDYMQDRRKHEKLTVSQGKPPLSQAEAEAEAEAEEKKKEQSAQRSQGSRLPSGWKPSDSLKAWASKERPDLDLGITADRFRDYWEALPGARGRKLDWDATFRNWVRSERAGSKPKEIDFEAMAKRLEEQERSSASV